MSYIDCFDHEYIGRLGYLPIYRPLQVIEGEEWGAYDFSATPDNLVLGGGSGEHPGLVIHKLECAAAKFLYYHIDEEHEEKISKEDIDFVTELVFEGNVLEFCGWAIRDYLSLVELAKSPAFGHPLKDDEEVEDWLIKSIGELVYFSLHELNSEHLRLAEIFAPFQIWSSMGNVMCNPPGYPITGGRIVEDEKVCWGKHRWQWKP
ncbi:MAG: hypothetical protein P8045_12215 [Candidatus Thiodiazotropha sp.]